MWKNLLCCKLFKVHSLCKEANLDWLINGQLIGCPTKPENGNSGDLSLLTFERYINPIPIKGDWLHPLHNLVPHLVWKRSNGPEYIGVHLLFQVLRSGCQWSIGISKTENSILLAYLNAIQGAKYYIYIENQFFITSSTKSGDSLSTSPSDTMEEIKNKVGRALVDKVVEAHK